MLLKYKRWYSFIFIVNMEIYCMFCEYTFQSEGNEEDELPASLPGGTTIVLNPGLDNDRPSSPDTTST